MRKFQVIMAIDANGGLAKDGKIPWKNSADMKHFKETTTKTYKDINGNDIKKQNVVIMGRKTWETLNGPLKNRINIVISKNYSGKRYEGAYHRPCFEDAMYFCTNQYEEIDQIFVIGGLQIYNEALNNYGHLCKKIIVTNISGRYNCDLIFDRKLLENYELLQNQRFIDGGSIYTYVPKETEEQQYLDLITNILSTGDTRIDRTGVGTHSLFGKCHMTFDLRDGRIPVLTTKKVFWKAVVEELLWFLSGSTDANILKDKGIHIWDGNTTREFLDSRGLTEYKEGDIGPGYGFQWRHFGAEYKGYDTLCSDCKASFAGSELPCNNYSEHNCFQYKGKGVDQIARIIDMIKNDPYSRRIILSAWNPEALDKMALPPCHIMAQFYVKDIKSPNSKDISPNSKDIFPNSKDIFPNFKNKSPNFKNKSPNFKNKSPNEVGGNISGGNISGGNISTKELSCLMYQRSADTGLGMPFNIASYSLLTHIIAKECGIKTGEFIYVVGDSHIYNTHVEAMKEQLKRKPLNGPTVVINNKPPNLNNISKSLFDIKSENIKLMDYESHERIVMNMAI